MDPNFSFQVNLTGVQAAGGGGAQLTEGYHKGKVIDFFGDVSSNGNKRGCFRIGEIEGFPGTVRTHRLTAPRSADDGVRYYWRAAMESMGYTPAEIDSGVVTVSRQISVGRPIHFYYVPGDKEAGIYEEIKVLSVTDWQTQKAAFDARGGAQGQAQATGSALGAAQAAPQQNVAAPAGGLGGGGLGGTAQVNMGGGLGGGGLNGGGLGGGLGGGQAPQQGLTPQQLMAQIGQ